jgi:hypothetical protein
VECSVNGDLRWPAGGSMIQSASTLSFGKHVHPEEVTPELRARIAQNITMDHLVWAGFLALMTLILMVGTAFVDTMDKVSPAILWHMGTILTLGLWAELICYFIYDNRKKLVRTGVATTAVVVRQQNEEDFASGVPRVQLRFVPKPNNVIDIDSLRSPDKSLSTWGNLDGLSDKFEKNLHVGDLVTILYDPDRPSHIRIVEFEH